MKHLISLLTTVCTCMLLSSCQKNANISNDITVKFTAALSGYNEIPVNSSTASGNSTGSYNTATKVLTLTTTYTGITVTYGHIHKGEMGINGAIEFPFMITASPIQFTSESFTDSEEADLMEGKFYVNLHSAAYPDGEIRGQLVQQ